MLELELERSQGQVPDLLLTLGALRYGAECEIKPLLLLTYLSLEGATARRELAHLLWPETKSPENNLRVALCTLKQWGVPLDLHGEFCATSVRCDAHDLLQARGLDVLCRYTSVFLEGVSLQNVSAEFEDWVHLQRERLAAHVQQEVLAVAQTQPFSLSSGSVGAADLAELAWNVAGAPPPEPIMLARLLALSQCHSELYCALVEELVDYGWSRRSLNTVAGGLKGRETVFLALLAWWLEGSGVAWISGEAGSGKTELGLELLRLLRLEQQTGLYIDGAAVRDLADLPTHLDQALLEGRNKHGALAPLVVLDNLEHWSSESNGALEALLRRRWPELRFVCLKRSAPAFGAQTLALHLGELAGQAEPLNNPAADLPVGPPDTLGRRLRREWHPTRAPLAQVPRLTGSVGFTMHSFKRGTDPPRAPP